MIAKPVMKGVYLVAMGAANAYLIDGEDGLTLVDAGFPKKESVVFTALQELGRPLTDLKHLILTHAHPDHFGSAAAIVRETGARTYMHPLDIPFAESGGPFRAMTPAPGLLRHVLCRVLFKPGETLEPVTIDQPIADSETLDIAGGIDVATFPAIANGRLRCFGAPAPCCSRRTP